jgi:hypothetical protein
MGRDRRGVSAVEFALIAPIMIMIYFAVAVLGGASTAQRRANHVAASIGDLVSQNTVVTPQDIADIFTVGDAVMSPWPTASLKMRLSSIKEDGQGAVTVAWSQQSRWTALTPGDPYEGPAKPLLTPGETIIIAEVEYQFASPIPDLNLQWFALPGAHPFHEVLYVPPRFGAAVTCPKCGT